MRENLQRERLRHRITLILSPFTSSTVTCGIHATQPYVSRHQRRSWRTRWIAQRGVTAPLRKLPYAVAVERGDETTVKGDNPCRGHERSLTMKQTTYYARAHLICTPRLKPGGQAFSHTQLKSTKDFFIRPWWPSSTTAFTHFPVTTCFTL